MKTIRIRPDETFQVEVEIDGEIVATQQIYMDSTTQEATRKGTSFEVKPLSFVIVENVQS